MEELCSSDRATGEGVRTASQASRIRQQRRLEVDLNDEMEYTPEPPGYEPRENAYPSSPPSMDEYSPGPTQSVPSVPSGGTSSSRGSKRKAPMIDIVDSQFDKLTTKLDGFMEVMGAGNSHFEKMSNIAERQVIAIEKRNDILNEQVGMMKRSSTFQYTESDIWEMLAGMNIQEENLMEQCYDYLCSNPTHTKRLMGMPQHLRLNKLYSMMVGRSG